jgi:3-isopropylmalate/(R)-2-methylmalate dehydratase small subunit
MTDKPLQFRGRVWTAGDNIDTDMILPGRFLYNPDKNAIRGHLFEGLDPTFNARIREGDLFVGGRNFGCGSARPAPLAMQMCGIQCVVAKSFSRTFLRSAIDTGVPILECDLTGKVRDGVEIVVDVESATVTLTTGEVLQGVPFPPFILAIFRAGGIIPYTRAELAQRAA